MPGEYLREEQCDHRDFGKVWISMRKYIDEQKKEPEAVFCNKCGRKLTVENGILKEGCFVGNHVFGYFSNKDGMRHNFDLCEECYDALVKTFVIPVCETEENELC